MLSLPQPELPEAVIACMRQLARYGPAVKK